MSHAWTESELAAEHAYVRTERLGILCGDGSPTPEQDALADKAADAHVEALRKASAP